MFRKLIINYIIQLLIRNKEVALSDYLYIKLSNEGTSSSFVARMFLGLMQLRAHLIMSNDYPLNKQITIEIFNFYHEPLWQYLKISLDSTRKLDEICNDLVVSGQPGNLIQNYPGGGSELINTKGPSIKKEFLSVINNLSVAIKNNLQDLLLEIYGFDISFLFKKDYNFKKGLENLDTIQSECLNQYFRDVRIWTSQLIDDLWNISKHCRLVIEDPKMSIESNSTVSVELPKVFDVPVNDYCYQLINNCCILIEDLLFFGFNYLRKSPFYFIEIPKSLRSQYDNVRFKARMASCDKQVVEFSFQSNLDIK